MTTPSISHLGDSFGVLVHVCDLELLHSTVQLLLLILLLHTTVQLLLLLGLLRPFDLNIVSQTLYVTHNTN